jgi:hypothetical protein
LMSSKRPALGGEDEGDALQFACTRRQRTFGTSTWTQFFARMVCECLPESFLSNDSGE